MRPAGGGAARAERGARGGPLSDPLPDPPPRRPVARRIAQGAALALGAPLGWLALRAAQGVPPAAALRGDPLVFAYLGVATTVVFALFGWLLGRSEARLSAAAERLLEMSLSDAGTGLKNVRYFRMRLEEEHARALREGTPLALVVLDVDHFKRVNDRHGHPVGDAVLRAVADAMRRAARGSETVARTGGEEFALLLPGAGPDEAVRAAERVRAAVAAARVPVPGGDALRVTVSAGVASAGPRTDPDALYAAADRAMYRAKRNGRDRVERADGAGESPAIFSSPGTE